VAGLVTAGLLALCIHLKVWLPPLVHPGGMFALVGAGIVLGIIGIAWRPSARVRAAAIAALVLAATAANLAWFRTLDRSNRRHTLVRQIDGRLDRRYREHLHWIPSRSAAYFLFGEAMAGKQVRLVPGTRLLPWRFLALSGAAEVAEIPPPAFSLPSARALEGHYLHRNLKPIPRSGEPPYRVVGIIEGAQAAGYFVAVSIDGVDFVIPGPVWEAIGSAQRARQP
jgi:hypothetical protein